MEELKQIIAEQSKRIRELEEYLSQLQIKPPLPEKIQNIINLSMKTKYSKKPQFLSRYWKMEASFYNDDIVSQKIQEARLRHGVEKIGKHIHMYYFNNVESEESIYEYLDQVYMKEDKAFKIHISFGYVSENITSGEVKLFAPTHQYFFDHPLVVKQKQDINTIKEKINRESIIHKISRQFPDTQTRLLGVYAMGVKLIRLDFPIGAKRTLPDFIKKSRFINALEGVDGNLCFWACVALAHGCKKDSYIKKMKELFKSYYNGTKDINNYAGFDFINELDKYELINTPHAINVVNYDEDNSISYIRKSNFNDERTPIYLNLYLDHFSYITNLTKLAKMYICNRCSHKFRDNHDLQRHIETCTLEQKDTFNQYPKIWQKKRNVIVELADYFEVIQDFKYDYLITFDLESLQPKFTEILTDNNGVNKKLQFVNSHIAVSVSIATNVPGFNDAEKFILPESPMELTKLMFEHFDKIAEKAKELMLIKMLPLIKKIDKHYSESQIKKFYDQIEEYCSSIPIVGFNSGFYDTNLLLDEGFMNEIIARDKQPFTIKDGKRFKVIKTKDFIFLDQMNYCSAGTSLEKFIAAYDVGESKGKFPYEWFDSYSKLNYLVEDLKIEDFDSTLKNKKLSKEEFDNLMLTCKMNNLVYVKDLLRWYNNLDVRPMLKACLKQKEFYYTFNLDMYKDALSLPGLSENILFQFSQQGFDQYLKEKSPNTIEAVISDEDIQAKIVGYKVQDLKAGRALGNFVILEEVRQLLEREKYSCYYCWRPVCQHIKPEPGNTWSLDRIDCSLSHTKVNCVIACVKCNEERSDTLLRKFYRKKALLRYEWTHPMIWEFSEENKDVFYKFKNNIIGGASIVYHRYHEKDLTQITRVHYDQTNKDWYYDKEGKTVKKIAGFDANALYLYCLGEEMPCGKLKWIETNDLKYVTSNDFFGFLEVDIEVPEDKYEYFSEMCPIFKNAEYSEDASGDYTKRVALKLHKKLGKSRKLIGALKATKILVKSSRLRWLIKHGCNVTKLYGVIPAKPGRIFKDFMDWVSDERRKGDVDEKYAIIAEGAKTVGNSAFGRTGMDKNKHKKVKFCDEIQFNRAKNNYFFYDAEEYNGIYEVIKKPKTVKQNMPIQIAFSVYDDSKLRMLQFYYDCVDKYLNRSDFQYMEMDTDSAYMALTDDFENLIKSDLRDEFEKDKNNWFPRNDSEANASYDKRKPGLFKIEFEGDGMVALCSKSYFVWGTKNKMSCKGIQQHRNMAVLNKEKYLQCLFNEDQIKGNNKGFRFVNKLIKTYEQEKIGLSPIYTKGVVMDDGIHIRPLDI